jgi:hypothetical protein
MPTDSFAAAQYTSDCNEFIARETAADDRNFEPLQEIDGQFMQVDSGYSPQLLEGMDHAKIKAELENPASAVGNAIKTEADIISALICKSIGSKGKSMQFRKCKELDRDDLI